MENKNIGFGTKAIHAGNQKDKQYQALTMPIYQTSTFYFNDCEEGGRKFAGKEDGYIYTRLGNPTTSVLEKKVAALEGADDCVAVASGIGAVSSIFWTMCKAGDHIIADGTLYGCTFAYLNHGLTRYGVEVSFINTSDLDEVKKALKPNTSAVYLETPANPTLKIADIKAVCDLVHNYKKDIKVVCDNTFCTPYLQRPLELGADAVIHSGTKYLNGHGDVIAGFILGKQDFINQVRLFGLKDMTGAVMGPFEAFLILRGLKTLELRMNRHCENAVELANYLNNHPMVNEVHYPGLESHKDYDIAKKQMSQFGGIVAFEVKGGREAGAKLLNSLKMCTIAVSLGDAETLVEHPASMTHSPYTSEELKAQGISESLVRVSVGLENSKDIIADFEQAFRYI